MPDMEDDFQDRDDLELDQMPEPLGSEYEPGADSRSIWPWVTGVAVVVALAGAGVWYWRLPAEQPAPKAAAEAPARSSPEVRAPLGPAVEPLELPPLDLTDSLVREMVRQLSSRPEVATWLATDSLIRNFAVSVDNVADGKSPARHLRALTPKGPFKAVVRGPSLQADARSFQRYNGLAETVASLDATALATLYSTLKPRIADAYRELGHPDGDIDAALERAIVHLLTTPAVPSDSALNEAVLSYRYVEERFESLTAAQKQMARMGLRNQELVQAKLREIALALGIPESRLPSPSRL